MKQTRLLMGMPITVEVVDKAANANIFDEVFDYFKRVDNRYSTYKKDSEISKINAGLPKSKWSREMKNVLDLCEQTKRETHGYFDITHNGQRDPSGLVKGWAIDNAADILRKKGFKNFYIEAGGDIQASGLNDQGQPWRIGIRNPFNTAEIVKIVTVATEGVATSGTYVRGQHIYNPLMPSQPVNDIASLTVIGPNIFNADRYATAAFAMGRRGIQFIESLKGYEAYMIDSDKMATLSSGFEKYEAKNA